MFRRPLVVIALSLFAAGLTGAVVDGQAPAPVAQPATGMIIGQVVDGIGGRPVGECVVTLSAAGASPVGPPARGAPATRRVITDGQGRFFFRDLGKGSYSLNATRPGYVTGIYGRLVPRGPAGPLDLADSERMIDVRILVWKQAAIAGRVLDEAGEPVVGATVRVFRSGSMSGRPGLTDAAGSTTDDRGIYRIASLAPDRYLVVVPSTATTIPAAMVEGMFRASGDTRAELQQAIFGATSSLSSPGSAPNQVVGDVILQVQSRTAVPPMFAADGSLAMYPSLFYPQAATAADATTIELAPGETRTGIDFQVRPVPTVRVSGTVSGPNGPVGNLALRLVRPGSDQLMGSVGFEVATTVADGSGAFTFLGVPPGQFIVRALKLPKPDSRPEQSVLVQTPSGTASRGGVAIGDAPPPALPQPTLWADQELAVGDHDVSGLKIALRSGFRLSGRLEFEGTSAHQPPQRFGPFFESADRVTMRQIPELTPAADGTFTSIEVPRGQYRLSIPTPSGWLVKSAMFEGRDLYDLPFDLNQNMAGVVVTLSDRGARISGTVRDDRSSPDPAAEVIVISVDPKQWVDFGAYARRIKDVRSRRDGAYAIGDLPAGEYFIAAIPLASVDWSMPGFFQALGRVGTRVTLTEGEQRSIDLKTVQLPRVSR